MILLIKKKSNINGIGIFTTKFLHKNIVFYEVPINFISNKPKSKCAYIGKNKWVLDENVLNYVNHSCEPNSILDISGQSKLIAKKDIEAGEEITVDYNETEKNGKRACCDCKSKNCRGYFLRLE